MFPVVGPICGHVVLCTLFAWGESVAALKITQGKQGMEITGSWNPQVDAVLDQLCRIAADLENGIRKLPQAEVREASSSLYSNVSAVSSTLYKICRDTSTRCSSQAVGGLLRMLIESSISVFAFCRDPGKRAAMYLNYTVVLRFRLVARSMGSIGCPFLAADRYDSETVRLAKATAKRDLLQWGTQYLKRKPRQGETTADVLAEATKEGSERTDWFRDHWFPEQNRSEVLGYEQMAWVDDVLYGWLCSCVHSDIWAGSPLAGLDRSHAAMVAMVFWGASVLRLSEALGLSLDPSQTTFLRDTLCSPLQWTPKKA